MKSNAYFSARFYHCIHSYWRERRESRLFFHFDLLIKNNIRHMFFIVWVDVIALLLGISVYTEIFYCANGSPYACNWNENTNSCRGTFGNIFMKIIVDDKNEIMLNEFEYQILIGICIDNMNYGILNTFFSMVCAIGNRKLILKFSTVGIFFVEKFEMQNVPLFLSMIRKNLQIINQLKGLVYLPFFNKFTASKKIQNNLTSSFRSTEIFSRFRTAKFHISHMTSERLIIS